jgi:DNA-binding NarL/FixJ family response regulator
MLNLSQDNLDSSSAIRVVIIEDQPEIREGLQQILDGAEGYSCTGGYESMEDALSDLPRLMKSPDTTPSVILTDIGLPQMSGIDGIRILKANYPSLPIMVLSVFEDDDRIFEAICAGATGYLLKKTPPDRLLASLREVVDGGSPMSPEVARRVVNLFHRLQPPPKESWNLTPHEKRILKLLVEGHIYKTAAAELKVSVFTISFHVRHIYEKLQVHSKSEAVAKAVRNNLV